MSSGSFLFLVAWLVLSNSLPNFLPFLIELNSLFKSLSLLLLHCVCPCRPPYHTHYEMHGYKKGSYFTKRVPLFALWDFCIKEACVETTP